MDAMHSTFSAFRGWDLGGTPRLGGGLAEGSGGGGRPVALLPLVRRRRRWHHPIHSLPFNTTTLGHVLLSVARAGSIFPIDPLKNRDQAPCSSERLRTWHPRTMLERTPRPPPPQPPANTPQSLTRRVWSAGWGRLNLKLGRTGLAKAAMGTYGAQRVLGIEKRGLRERPLGISGFQGSLEGTAGVDKFEARKNRASQGRNGDLWCPTSTWH